MGLFFPFILLLMYCLAFFIFNHLRQQQIKGEAGVWLVELLKGKEVSEQEKRKLINLIDNFMLSIVVFISVVVFLFGLLFFVSVSDTDIIFKIFRYF